MPEGDTVFLAGRRLDDALAGALLVRGELRHPRLIEHDLAGRTVLGVASVGKHLFTRFDDGRSLHTHFRMDGTWHLYRPGRPWRGADHQVRAVLATDDRVAVGFRLHDMELLATERESDLVGHLGPDLLGDGWDDTAAAEVARRLAADPDREVGSALLDQRIACGVGNIYKTEVCFLLGVSPWTRVGDLSERQVHDAVSWARKLLLRNAWRPEQSTTGDLAENAQHWVFERGGRGCRRCRDVVRTAGQDDTPAGAAPREERIAYFCPTCQPGPHPALPPRRGRRPQQQSGRRARYGPAAGTKPTPP